MPSFSDLKRLPDMIDAPCTSAAPTISAGGTKRSPRSRTTNAVEADM